jgi:hypothetical protein
VLGFDSRRAFGSIPRHPATAILPSFPQPLPGGFE